MHRLAFVVPIIATLTLGLGLGCREEGPAERLGGKVDRAVEDVSAGAEGRLERMGRQVDEAVDETREAADEIEDAIEETGR